jgi:hypothetical protein
VNATSPAVYCDIEEGGYGSLTCVNNVPTSLSNCTSDTCNINTCVTANVGGCMAGNRYTCSGKITANDASFKLFDFIAATMEPAGPGMISYTYFSNNETNCTGSPFYVSSVRDGTQTSNPSPLMC